MTIPEIDRGREGPAAVHGTVGAACTAGCATPRVTDRAGREQLDRLGAVASMLCAVHCVVVAILPAAVGGLGLGFLLGRETEWAFTLVAIACGSGALTLGWRRHRSFLVAGLLVVGIVGLLASRGLEMGLVRHEHHGAPPDAALGWSPPHAEASVDEANEHGTKHTERHQKSQITHAGAAHVAGTIVGVLAGLLLLFGHVLNIRAAREC